MSRFNPFQWAVDTSQKPSIWWCNVLLRLYVVGVLLAQLFRTTPFDSDAVVGMAMSFLVAFSLWKDARSQADLASNRRVYFICAWFSWPLVALSFVLFFFASSAEGAAFLLHAFSFASYCSFALCHPPAPPKHKHSFAPRPEGT